MSYNNYRYIRAGLRLQILIPIVFYFQLSNYPVDAMHYHLLARSLDRVAQRVRDTNL